MRSTAPPPQPSSRDAASGTADPSALGSDTSSFPASGFERATAGFASAGLASAGLSLAGVPPVIAVVGPTAAGKSALSLSLAEALGGEIVNADSMQLYRGMDIGTAKLSTAEQRGIPHHLLDIWDVTEPASVAMYQSSARVAIDDIRRRGRIPLLVGGSGLYVRAVLEHFEFPGTDPAVRADLEAALAADGAAALHARLTAEDPAAAAKILPSNGRRIVRALEVIALTGAPFTAALPAPTPVYPAIQLGVDQPTGVLDARIAARVEQMWARGMVDEVRALEKNGLREGRTASRALGYQQVLAHLDGARTSAEAAADTIVETRRFARRQRKWFRRDPRVVWLDGDRPDLVEAALAAIRSTPYDLRDRCDLAGKSVCAGAAKQRIPRTVTDLGGRTPGRGSAGRWWDGGDEGENGDHEVREGARDR